MTLRQICIIYELKEKIMKTIKTLITIVLMSISYNGMAQHSISYSYDAAGNRTGRSITVTPVKDRDATDIEEVNDNPEGKVRVMADSKLGVIKVEIIDYSDNDQCHITLFDTGGTVLTDIPEAEPVTLIDISDKPSGIYILQAVLNGRSDTWKIAYR
jgi:hypothetical protein